MLQCEGMAYIGQIYVCEDIECADFIDYAEVVCGKGGRWRGVVKKGASVGDRVMVFLPDALLPEDERWWFMEAHKWRVKIRRFKGVPSEVLILPIDVSFVGRGVGDDITTELGVKRYVKPVPAKLQGKAIGAFPSFIPKTDEPNYQSVPEMVEAIMGKSYVITEKLDGSSCTVYRYNNHFGVCSRNWEIERDDANGYWEVANKYNLEELLPDGLALQFEVCGPKIQTNPLKLDKIDGFAFSAYDIKKHAYLEEHEFAELCAKLTFSRARKLDQGSSFDYESIDALDGLVCGKYVSGKPREGVVVRSTYNMSNGKPISFKIINLDYEK